MIRFKLPRENWREFPESRPRALGVSASTRAGLVIRSFPIQEQATAVADAALRLLLLDAIEDLEKP